MHISRNTLINLNTNNLNYYDSPNGTTRIPKSDRGSLQTGGTGGREKGSFELKFDLTTHRISVGGKY